jgi:hypothetical protein
MSLTRPDALALALILLAGANPHTTAAQRDGSAPAAVAGGALGLFSGAMLGVAGSVSPCTQTWDGAACIRWHALGGGALGLVGGALAGGTNPDRIGGAALSAGIGFVAGGAAGLVLKPIAQRFGWHDVFTVGLLGAAVGASPRGAALGLGAGAVAGAIVWRLTPGGTFPDALAAALAGMALGGVSGWLVHGFARDTPDDGPPVLVPLGSIRF